ncbi:MAG: Uma2 family endonuclease [Gemmatimonadaceae bacterium]
MGMALDVPRFTIDMLDDFPDDGNRYELLEGILLVTPAPSNMHQVVATRLVYMLMDALDGGRLAQVVAVGAIQRGKTTQLQPDILVSPASFPPGTHWGDISGWWLAVEVISPSSRIYDREVKRAAYLALGVEEYWLVDPRNRSVEVWKRGQAQGLSAEQSLTWRPSGLTSEIVIDLGEIFRDIDGDDYGT